MWSLRLVGLLYLMSGTWCAFNPAESANFLGFSLVDLGMAEFVSVYGGLQLGLGAAMVATSLKVEYLDGGLVFALITSLGLLIARFGSIMSIGANSAIYAMAILEFIIVVLLAVSFIQRIKGASKRA